jgi:DNA ligase D-like protein (predicted 3'-phosphoesterase)
MAQRQLIFVVQKHNASHLHYDVRLEHNGVLKSWAVPKEPPREAGVKRLAIQVEDHPLEYAGFEGIIEEGRYGAGTVAIWDQGTYVPVTFKPGEIIARLAGEKLTGEYCLIKIRGKAAKENTWLFFKRKKDS